MHLAVISSLDALCRRQACEILAEAFPHAVVVVHDLLDDGRAVRRTFRRGSPAERVETTLEHGCPSCAVRLDLAPALGRLAADGEEHVVLGLPAGVPASTAIQALEHHLDQPPTVDSAVLACSPAAVEDQLWDGQTLAETGLTTAAGDDRTPGEFLVGELAFNDTVLAADPDPVPVSAPERLRGIQLLRELAPHADVVEHGAGIRRGGHHRGEALRRSTPGRPAPEPHSTPASPFTTVVHRVDRPLHPERFHRALSVLAQGCCRLSGQVWLAVAPEYRFVLQGIGPRVWLQNTGPWPAEDRADLLAAEGGAEPLVPDGPGDHATVLTATGEDLDPAEMARLLASCRLTQAELAAGITGLTDPFGIGAAH
ncbi:GTP-binding protein [Kocuria sp. M1R5S2]|uniref:GTP-binding protein n=1 Tax=Kocuria rhizosphaerae TaxID=3376285 RepID=UPI0037875E10